MQSAPAHHTDQLTVLLAQTFEQLLLLEAMHVLLQEEVIVYLRIPYREELIEIEPVFTGQELFNKVSGAVDVLVH